MVDAVVAGHICLDIIPDLSSLNTGQFEETFQPGRLMQSGPATLSTGGVVSNTGLALHRLGISTRLIAKVGADRLGRTLRQCLTDQGSSLDEGIITSPNSTTSYSIVISPPGTDRRFLHHPGSNNDFCESDVKDEQISDARLFHFGYPPLMERMYANNGSQLADLFKRVKKFGLTTSLDMAFPDPNTASGKADWRSILRSVLPFVDVFVPSMDEILFMLQKPTISSLSPALLESVSAELLDMGTSMVLLKLGDRGLYLRTADSIRLNSFGKISLSNSQQWADFKSWEPCFEVDVVGTTGSGDVTVAGFLAALVHGLSPIESITFALAVGACNVESPDALSGIRTWDETWRRVNSGWARKKNP